MKQAEYEELIRDYPDLAEFFEYVEGSRGLEGYYRRIAKTRFKPTRDQKRWQLKFTETAHDLYDENLSREKYVEAIKERLEGKKVAPPKHEKILRDLRKALIEIQIQVEKQKKRGFLWTNQKEKR